MAKKYGFLICILVMVMDIIAGILGIQAETSQNKEKHMKIWLFDCRYPSHQAFKLGVAAIILLLLAHAIANLLGGCICVRSRDHHIPATANRQLAVAFQIFSWCHFVFHTWSVHYSLLCFNHSHEKGRKEATNPRTRRNTHLI
ncbi:protein DESIGUAL 2-like isoform X2 [Vicia villosa]|uniref:protein DESIGUAL 2-like isoform X2 n=1 Tax=Vicia villosa TaxID=3911 RepID=UPI00273C6DC2|nr:protein DESIGUAL 2-like isoform X2 [Vicia villosa]